MTDTRAQIGITRFFLALIVGAPLAYVVGEVVTPLLEHAGEASAGTPAAPATQWFITINQWLVVVFLGVAFFGLLSLAIYQRGVGR